MPRPPEERPGLLLFAWTYFFAAGVEARQVNVALDAGCAPHGLGGPQRRSGPSCPCGRTIRQVAKSWRVAHASITAIRAS